MERESAPVFELKLSVLSRSPNLHRRLADEAVIP
jgi:hypothetical protein